MQVLQQTATGRLQSAIAPRSPGSGDDATTWERPIPLVGDVTSAQERALDPGGWSFDTSVQTALADVIAGRRDIRRYRPNPVPPETLLQILAAGHAAPSVGHSQPWRFVVVTAAATRDRAASLADRARHAQAAVMDDISGQHLLDLQLDGIREAPVGIVVCCDRRVTPQGVLGRGTFHDADIWSCACAIQNMWLTARAGGLGMGWVTLFEPHDLAELVGLPAGVVSLGWMCLGYPDERPPEPGLSRAGWSSRLDLGQVVISERWQHDSPEPPRDRIGAPASDRVVAAHDDADSVLTVPGSLGRLDQAVDRVIASCGRDVATATLVLVGGDHPVADLGVTAYSRDVTAEVLAAARAGESIGVATARTAGVATIVIDAGASTGNLVDADAMSLDRVEQLLAGGTALGVELAPIGLVLLGEVGIGNTTVAAALACALLGADPGNIVGLGAGSDSAIVEHKRQIVAAALSRIESTQNDGRSMAALLAAIGGPEIAYLTGLVLGVARTGGMVVLDGMVTGVAALLACEHEPATASHLIAGQRSREIGHTAVLQHLGLTALLDLRLRSGEGVGAVIATRMLLDALATRRAVARVNR